MAKLPEQSYDYDLPLMKLAAEITRISALSELSETTVIHFGPSKQTFASCLIDTSVISWFASGPGEGNGRERRQRDLDAFLDLILLAELRLIKLFMPPTVRDELRKATFSPSVKLQINDLMTRGRVSLQTETLRFTVGQRTYGASQVAAESEGAELSDELNELLDSEPDPSVPKEDRDHYLMACLSHRPFVTMDYTLVGRMATAIQKQVALASGENQQKSIPKKRPPLKAPVVTPSVFLQQTLKNHSTWSTKLDLARMEPSCGICEDLRRQLASIGQELAELVVNAKVGQELISTKEVEFNKLEQELASNNCRQEFFRELPEEVRPDYWKTLHNNPSTVTDGHND